MPVGGHNVEYLALGLPRDEMYFGREPLSSNILASIKDIDEGIPEQIPTEKEQHDRAGAGDQHVRVVVQVSAARNARDKAAETGRRLIDPKS